MVSNRDKLNRPSYGYALELRWYPKCSESYVRIKYLRKSYGLILMRILILISLVTNKLTKPIYYLRTFV